MTLAERGKKKDATVYGYSNVNRINKSIFVGTGENHKQQQPQQQQPTNNAQHKEPNLCSKATRVHQAF